MVSNIAISVFEKTLKEAHYIESHLIEILPQLRDSSFNEKIKADFDSHLKETKEHLHRIEKIFKLIEKSPQSRIPHVFSGLVEDRKASVRELPEESIEFLNVYAALATERLEIGIYELLIKLAKNIDMKEAVELLKQTLSEEKTARRKMWLTFKMYDMKEMVEAK